MPDPTKDVVVATTQAHQKPASSVSDQALSANARFTVFISDIYNDDRRLQLALLMLMLLVYGVLLGICLTFRTDATMTLTFNSMFSHLMHGRFDVDPEIVGPEGHLFNGRVYAYWGIFPALLRFPLWLLGRMNFDLTYLSSLAAVCIAAAAKVRAVLLIRLHGVRTRAADWAVGLMLGYILLGGSEVGFLNLSIYQEAIFWAYAFAAIFVYFAIKGLVNHSFNTSTLSGMASCAGLALLTRASTGVGLVVTFALLLMVLVCEDLTAAATDNKTLIRRLGCALIERRIVVSAGLLVLLVVLVGAVNYGRWGNPATFVDASQFCTGCSTNATLGFLSALYNFKRIPFGIIYYFFPAWVVHDSGGHLFMEDAQTHLVDSIELPPSSFLLTDLLPLCFIAFFVLVLLRYRPAFKLSARHSIAIGVGLFVPCLEMLTLAWMHYRYRMEFYPEIDFLALIALYLIVTNESILARFNRYRTLMITALGISALSSIFVLALYDMSDTGPAQDYIRPGIVRLYSQGMEKHYHSVLKRVFKVD